MKKIVSLLLSTFLLLTACSENLELKKTSAEDKEKIGKEMKQVFNTKKGEELEKPNLSLANEEELVKWYYKLLNDGNIGAIGDITTPEQLEVVQQSLTNITNHLSSNEIKINFLETIEILTSGASRAIIVSSEILNKDNERLQVEINSLSLVKHEDGFKLAFDVSQLEEEYRKAFEDIQQQLNTLIQNDEQMKEHLAWLDAQNQAHQQAFQDHMSAHQQFMNQTQQQQMQQMQQQQMMPPPSGF